MSLINPAIYSVKTNWKELENTAVKSNVPISSAIILNWEPIAVPSAGASTIAEQQQNKARAERAQAVCEVFRRSEPHTAKRHACARDRQASAAPLPKVTAVAVVWLHSGI